MGITRRREKRTKVVVIGTLMLLALPISSIGTFAWFANINYAPISYANAYVSATNADLGLTVTSATSYGAYSGTTRDAEGVNTYNLSFGHKLDDVSFGGGQRWYDVEWTTYPTAGTISAWPIGDNSSNPKFFAFQVEFSNNGTTDLDIYLDDGCTLAMKTDDSSTGGPNYLASLSERVAIIHNDSAGGTSYKTVSYWIPNHGTKDGDRYVDDSSGAGVTKYFKMVGPTSNYATWSKNSFGTGSTVTAYGTSYTLGDPLLDSSPINHENLSTILANDHLHDTYTNICHVGNFSKVTDSNEFVPDNGQYVGRVAHGGTYQIYVALWLEGTDVHCNNNTCNGQTTLTLDFEALAV